MRIDIIGVPFNGLGEDPEIENPASGLRQAGMISALRERGHDVTDLGDLVGFQCRDIRDPVTGINDFEMWLDLSRELSDKVGSTLDRKSFPIILGGDCRLLVGVMKALVARYTDAGLVFVDGHADFHTAETSPTGDPADMELAVLTGRGPSRITEIAGTYPMLNDSDVVVYGIRAWDHIDKSDIAVYDRKRLGEIGLSRAVDEGLVGFTEQPVPVWLHLDVDALDPEVMPVMFPEKGGLSFEEAHELLRFIWNKVDIAGLSIACYHPWLDEDGKSGTRLVDLVAGVVSGNKGNGRLPDLAT